MDRFVAARVLRFLGGDFKSEGLLRRKRLHLVRSINRWLDFIHRASVEFAFLDAPPEKSTVRRVECFRRAARCRFRAALPALPPTPSRFFVSVVQVDEERLQFAHPDALPVFLLRQPNDTGKPFAFVAEGTRGVPFNIGDNDKRRHQRL
ncbi:MAG: hypothetical protein H7Y38_14915 [Armatimonadetes bacterium]|nr:hypothetical protein [Armatimonadota bacterium]